MKPEAPTPESRFDAGRAEHPSDELMLLLDGALEGEELAAVERHLSQCAQCRLELEVMRRVKTEVRGLESPVPPTLEVRIRSALDREDAMRAQARSSHQRIWLAAAAGLVGVVLAAVFFLRPSPSPPDQAVQLGEHDKQPASLEERGAAMIADARATFVDVREGRLEPQLISDDATQLESWFQDQDLGFRVRVFDLAGMGWRLSGASKSEIADQPSALYTYVGPDGREIVCQMFLGDLEGMPPPLEQRVNDQEIELSIYQRDEIVLVFWREGDVVCVMTSDLGREDVIALAAAKAMQV